MAETAAPTQYLDPEVLRSISSIELKARLLVEGTYASRHRSPHYGYTVEFKDHREYVPGDDPRMIDWRTLARTEKLFIKRFEMESDMAVTCVLDTSASMGYRPVERRRLSKEEYAAYLVASLCYLAQRQQDAPGLITFDDTIRDFVPPKQGQRHLFTILARLDRAQAAGAGDPGRALQQISQRLKRRGLVLVVTDGWGETERLVDGIGHLRARGHDVVLLHLLDHDEITFPFQSMASFQDLETGAQTLADPLRQRRTYLERFEAFRAAVEKGCVDAGADYRLVDTADPIEQALRSYLLERRREGR